MKKKKIDPPFFFTIFKCELYSIRYLKNINKKIYSNCISKKEVELKCKQCVENYICIREWNSLPANVANEGNIETFKVLISQLE